MNVCLYAFFVKDCWFGKSCLKLKQQIWSTNIWIVLRILSYIWIVLRILSYIWIVLRILSYIWIVLRILYLCCRCIDRGDRKFPCSLCTRSFEKRDRLRIHVLHVHEKHRPHKCAVCGKLNIMINILKT